MLTNLIFLAMLGSGSVFAASWFGVRFERTLPLCAMGSVLLLFIFGLLGQLEAGAVCLYLAAAVLYLLAAAGLLRSRDLRGFLGNLVTPGAVLFVLLCVLLSRWNEGKMAESWDEFSHWVDTVKAMTYLGDFGTNPAANTAFQSYPPAMALFQYSLQKLHMLLTPGGGFSEWRVYYAYQIWMIAVVLPVFQELSFRHLLKLLLNALIILLFPLVFFSNLYNTVYIDPVLGILFGAGMAMTVLRRKRDGWCTAYICMICSVLTLSKDVGFVFSLMLALTYGADSLLDRRRPVSKRVLPALLAPAAAWIPKLLWAWEIQNSGAAAGTPLKIDWRALSALLAGEDTTYRAQVLQNYREALRSRGILLESLSLELSYTELTLITLGFLLLLWLLFRKKAPESGRQWGMVLGIGGITLIGYILGLGILYLFRFSEYEALRLASMDRYLNIAFLGVWFMILLLLVRWLDRNCATQAPLIALTLVLVLVAPLNRVSEFARGDYVANSQKARQPYEQLREQIAEFCDGDDRIYFISQATTGFDYWVSRFNARPNSFNPTFHSWSVGQPFFDGDVWTQVIAPSDWQKLLLEEYDYVALYRVNDYFLKNFGGLFENPEKIEENALYRVNRLTGLLEKCE